MGDLVSDLETVPVIFMRANFLRVNFTGMAPICMPMVTNSLAPSDLARKMDEGFCTALMVKPFPDAGGMTNSYQR